MVAGYQLLPDSQWQVIALLLPLQCKRRLCSRQVVDTLRYARRTGCQWRSLPACFLPWPAVYYYFARWQTNGTLQRLNEVASSAGRLASKRLPTPWLARVDAQSVKLAPRLGRQQASAPTSASMGANGKCTVIRVGTFGACRCTPPNVPIAGRPAPYCLAPHNCASVGPVGCAKY